MTRTEDHCTADVPNLLLPKYFIDQICRDLEQIRNILVESGPCVLAGVENSPPASIGKLLSTPHVIRRAAGLTGAVILGPQAGASVLTWSGQVCLSGR